MSLISLNNVVLTYGNGGNAVNAVDGLCLKIERGEFVSIIGKSGCGKSSLLNIIGGLCKPNEGEYLFDGDRISSYSPSKLALFRRNNVGFVVQHFALVSSLTVRDNIAVPLIYKKMKKSEINKKICEVTSRLGIADQINKFPYELSGGQQQRVAIARAVVSEPRILLADEPTGALDEQNGKEVFNILQELNNSGITIVLVTHDLDLASLCSRKLVMQNGKILLSQ